LLRQLYATFSRRSREQLGSRDPLVGLAHPLWPAKEMRARHPFHANRPHVGFPTRSMTHTDPGYLVARVIRAMPDCLDPRRRGGEAGGGGGFTGRTQIDIFVMVITGGRAKKSDGRHSEIATTRQGWQRIRTMQTINLGSVDGDNHDVRYTRLSGSLGCLVLRNRPCRSTIQHLRYPHGRNRKRSTRDAG
jgi:hypothetical protein